MTLGARNREYVVEPMDPIGQGPLDLAGLMEVDVAIHDDHVANVDVGGHGGHGQVLRRTGIVPIDLDQGEKAVAVGRNVHVGRGIEMTDESAQ